MLREALIKADHVVTSLDYSAAFLYSENFGGRKSRGFKKMGNIKGVRFEVIEIIEQVKESPDGWAVRKADGLPPGEYGYHFNFFLDNGQEVVFTFSESALTEMLDKVRACRAEYGG